MDVFASPVAQATRRAAHRRDHGHDQPEPPCHPHAVEVIHLGDRAFTVCHDCCTDSGLMPERAAQRLADEHRRVTAVASVPLPRGAGG